MPAPFRWITAPFRRRSRQQDSAAWEDQDIIALATALFAEPPDPTPSTSNNNHGDSAAEPLRQEPMDETSDTPAAGESEAAHAAAAPEAPAQPEGTGEAAVLVDPLQRARAALEDARRQMPGLMGLSDEPNGVPPAERSAIVPVQESRLAEWNALLQELAQERRALSAQIGDLRTLVLELRGEVQRLNDMLAAPEAEAAAPAAEQPAPAATAPEEAASAASVEAYAAPAAAERLDVEATVEAAPAPAAHGLEVNVRLLAEIEERLARGFAPEPARPPQPSWMEHSIWRLPVNAPAPLPDATSESEPAAFANARGTEATAAPVPEPSVPADVPAPVDHVAHVAPRDADATLLEPLAAAQGTPAEPEAVAPPLQPPAPAGSVVRDFGWRVHPDALEDRLPESWHRHAGAAPVPRPTADPPPGIAPGEAASLSLLVGPVAGIKRLAALERRLAASEAVQRLELATFRGGDALFQVRLRPGAAPQALLSSVGDEDARVGDYTVTEDRRSLTVRLQAVAPRAGAG